jgi:beta-glucosidase
MRFCAGERLKIFQRRLVKAAIIYVFVFSIISLGPVWANPEGSSATSADTNDGSPAIPMCGPTARYFDNKSSYKLAGLPLATYPFQDANLPLETRVNDLISRLTLSEKVSLLHQWQPAISRLGIASFRTGTEALHGVAWLGTATVFPQAIGLASTWDPNLVRRVGSAVGDEVRAKHYEDPVNVGLSVWSPVVDALRDPRAGRTEEGYSEDPYLAGRISIAYASGMKGDDPFYYKAIPSLKHFYAYNQEANRDIMNVILDERNRREYYLEFFRYAIQAGAAKSMMTAYNLVNGIPCTVQPAINEFVKSQWAPIAEGNDFFVVTDAYAPANLTGSQGYYSTAAQSHAGMIKAGVDSMTQDGSNPTNTINNINAALTQGLLTEADINAAVRNILRVRFHTGEFDGALDPYRDINTSIINSPASQALAREAVRKSVVLLKNEDNTLPIDKNNINSVAVLGERANQVLLDWYSGTLPYSVTPLQGIQNKVAGSATVTYSANNASIAASADVAIVVVGNRPQCNGGWAGSCPADEGKETIDRTSIDLNSVQETLIRNVYAVNPNTVVVLISSFPYAINWADGNVPAILYLSHGGQELGNGLADVLFGDYSPAGRLTMTWYSSLSQIPAKTDYDVINGERTYMYFEGAPLYPFGHGLTYTTFDYSNLRLSSGSIEADGQVTVSVDVTNTGSVTSDEVVQLYVKDVEASLKRPMKELLGFERVSISPAQTKTVNFTLPASELAFWDATSHNWFVEGGYFDVMVGSSSEDIRLTTSLYVVGDVANILPNVSITSLVGGDIFAIGDDIVIEANASDTNGFVTKVEFFQGSTKLGEDTSSPYSCLWSNVPAGRYSLTARATDNNDGINTSAAVNISVTSGDATGCILREWWTGISGNPVSNLTSNINYPFDPNGRELITTLEGPTDWADNYGTRIRGFLYPPADGSYTFWIASDDYSQLWLSADADPCHAAQIAYVNGWTSSRQWTKYSSQTSSPKSLLAGHKYYIEVLQKEGTGGDNVAVAWEGPGITQQVIDGVYLSPWLFNFRDFAVFANQWLRTDCTGTNAWCYGADHDRDGSVALDDLQAFANVWLVETE